MKNVRLKNEGPRDWGGGVKNNYEEKEKRNEGTTVKQERGGNGTKRERRMLGSTVDIKEA